MADAAAPAKGLALTDAQLLRLQRRLAALDSRLDVLEAGSGGTISIHGGTPFPHPAGAVIIRGGTP